MVVYFEEQGIYSNQPGAEFYITIYGSIAQSESENISANVKWGKARSAKEGNVPFHYKNFLGYRKGADGKPEIDPDEAETIRFIYERFLAGDSLLGIAQKLNDLQVPTPSGKGLWQNSTIQSILSNEKYGAYKHWELERCLTEKDCPLDGDSITNLRFLIGIRHEIEHRECSHTPENAPAGSLLAGIVPNPYWKRKGR